MQKIIAQLAQEIRVRPQQIEAAVQLLDGGATVPFIARYRKEVTDGLDDVQLRELEARLAYLRELRDRKEAVTKAIGEQGKLTPALVAAINAAASKQEVEDLYLPFKLKRRTKGQLAREAGLEPLADALFENPTLVPAEAALPYVIAPRPMVDGEDRPPDFSTVQAVLDGVRDLLSERWAEQPALVQNLRHWLWQEGLLQSKLASGKDETHADVAKFRDYFDYDEPIGRAPSHRALAYFADGPWTFSKSSLWSKRKKHLQPPLVLRQQLSIQEQSEVGIQGSQPRFHWPKRASPWRWAGATRAGQPTT